MYYAISLQIITSRQSILAGAISAAMGEKCRFVSAEDGSVANGPILYNLYLLSYCMCVNCVIGAFPGNFPSLCFLLQAVCTYVHILSYS